MFGTFEIFSFISVFILLNSTSNAKFAWKILKFINHFFSFFYPKSGKKPRKNSEYFLPFPDLIFY